MELNIKCKHIVTPAEPTWKGCQSLSEWDQIGSTTHAKVIYFYHHPNSSSLTPTFDSIIHTLENSLSRVLVPFYPVAGRLHSIGRSCFELVCNGKGVVYVAAELNADLVDFGDFTPSPKLDQYLFPAIDYNIPIDELPILFVQVTKFKCGGVSLSLAMSHVVADGKSTAQFVAEWARLARGETLLIVPVLERKAFRAGEPPKSAPRFDHSGDFGDLPFLLKQPSSQELNKMKTTMVKLGLDQGQVEKLRKMANQSLDGARSYTRYESIATHIWRCSSKARKHESQQQTTFLVTLDSRNRLQRPLPLGYFGNAIFDVAATCYAGELMFKPLSYGASKIRASIEKVTDEYVWSAIDYLKNEQDLAKFQYSYKSSKNGGGNLLGNPNIGLVNLLNLPFKGMDFGWGKEIYYGPGYHEKDGDAWLLRNGDEDGSLVVLICLLEDHIEGFKKSFYEDLQSCKL